jgi:hypothetical protein
MKFVVFAVLACTVFGFAVMNLWNWLTPPLFGWHTIGFWQAVGLLILTRILFGGRGFRGGPQWGGHWRRRMFERWAQMSPEEREKFRQGMRFGCGPFEPPMGESKPFESFG